MLLRRGSAAKNRYEVAANVVKKYYSSAKNAIISNGYAYADGLTGSVLAAKQNRPMMFTNASSLPTPTREVIGSKNMTTFTVLGGTVSLQSNVVSQLKNPIVGKKSSLMQGTEVQTAVPSATVYMRKA